MGVIVGRSVELDRLHTILAASRGAWVCGPRGIGVSALLRACAEAERTRGRHVLHTVGPVHAEPLDFARSVLGTDTSIAGFGSAYAATDIEVLVIDDAHQIDDDSIEALRLAVLNHGATVVAGSTETRINPALSWLASSGTLERIELLPLDVEATADLISTLFGRPPDDELARATHRDSAGRPAFAVATLDLAETMGAITERGGRMRLRAELPVTSALRDRARELCTAASADARAALDLLCLAGPLPLSIAMKIIDIKELTELETLRLIDVDSAGPYTIRLVTVALARTLADDLGYFGRRRVAEVLLAHGAAIPFEVAQAWRITAGADIEPGELVRAAEQWRDHGELGRAADLAEQAWDAGDSRGGLLLAQVYAARGHRREAADLLEALLARTDASGAATTSDGPAPDVVTQARLELASLRLWSLNDAPGALELATANVAASPDPARSGLAHAMLGSIEVYTGDPVAAARTVAPWTDDAVAGELCSQVQAVAETLLGNTSSALALARQGLARSELRDQSAIVGGLESEIHAYTVALACVAQGELAGLAKFLDDWLGRSLAVGLHTGWIDLAHTRLALAVGDVDAAERHAAEAERRFTDLDNQPARRWALAGRLLAACARDDNDAIEPLRAALHEVGPSAVTVLDTDVERALAWSFARHDPDRALAQLQRAAADAERRGAVGLAAEAWFDCARIGDATDAAAALARLEPQLDDRWINARMTFAQGRTTSDTTALSNAMDGFASVGAHLYAAETAAILIDLARRNADRAGIRSATDRFGQYRDRCTAAKTPLTDLAHRVSLSPREHEIAAFAAEGWTSREISDRLGVSSRTVDNLLQRVYAKLGIGGRAELTEAFATVTQSSP